MEPPARAPEQPGGAKTETWSSSLAQTPAARQVRAPAGSRAAQGSIAAGQRPGRVAFGDTLPACSGVWPRGGNGDRDSSFFKGYKRVEKGRRIWWFLRESNMEGP